MLAAHESDEYTRVLRGDLLTTLSDDFVTVARSAGLPARTIMLRYALRPSMLTVMKLAVLNFGRLPGGTVIAETIFSMPDIAGLVVFIAVCFVVVNLIIDTLCATLDPRVRVQGGR